MKETDRFCDLVKYMEDYFPEVEGMILEDLGEQDSGYQAVCEQLCSMIRKYPFITAIIEGSGDIVLSAEEHQILKEFFKTDIEKEEIERKQLYFQGHVDGYAYLKKIKAVRQSEEWQIEERMKRG